jgi:cytochrome P450
MSRRHPNQEGPGPPGSWLLGSARDLQRDQLGTYAHAMGTYGDFAHFRIGPPRVGFAFDAVFNPEGARQILSTGLGRYVKEAPVYTEVSRVLGQSLGTCEGDLWLRRRRTLQPLFTRQEVATYVPGIFRAADDLAASWSDSARRAHDVDLYEGTRRYALDVLGTALFGGEMHDMAPTLRQTITLLSTHAAKRGLAPVRVPASWPTPANRRADRARRTLYELVDGLVSRRRSDASADDLVGRLLAARDPETGEALDASEIRNELVLFLVAGHETTASSLAFILDLLGRHDDVQDRVRAEAGRVRADKVPTLAEVQQLQYTSQVVDEALRLFPPLHTIVRCAKEGGEILGYKLPSGRILAVNVWGVHHNPRVWPDPERFDPDRFSPGTVTGHDRYAHLPFGGGPRACIGVHLALAELVVATATLVRRYRLQARPDPPTVEAGVTLAPRDPMWCRLKPIDL